MATSATTNIDFSPPPRTPLSTSKHDVRTPKSITIRQESSVDNSPRRGRLLGTLKTLRPGIRPRISDENEGPSSASRKKSAWDVFGTFRSRRDPQNSSDSSNHASSLRARTASPSKKETPDEIPIHRPLQRCKSLGDILGTITNRVNLKRSLIFHNNSVQLDISTLVDNTVMDSQENPSSYTGKQITKAESESLPLLSIQIPRASLDDIDKFTAQTDRVVDGYKIIQTEELLGRRRGSSSSSTSCKHATSKLPTFGANKCFQIGKSGSRTLIGSTENPSGDTSTPDNNFRSLTPDSYLNLLINGHEDPRYATPGSASLSPSRAVAVEATEFLADTRSFSANRRFSLVDKTYLHDNKKSTLFACPEGTHFEPVGHQDQVHTITIREVDPEFEIEDLDPHFRRRSDVRRKRYQQLAIAFDRQFPNGTSLENSIRMTVARMTRNFHGSALFEEGAYFSDNEGVGDEEKLSSFEQDENEVLKAIAIGKQIFNKETKYQRMKKMPSSDEACQGINLMDKLLQETIDLRNPLETYQESSRFLEITRECVFVDYSAWQELEESPRLYANKSDAISGLYGTSGEISCANFCTHDPRSRTIYPYSPSTTVPNLEDLLRKGQEIIWLPVHNGSPVGRKSFHSVLENTAASQEACSRDSDSEYDVEEEHNSDFQDVDYESLSEFYEKFSEIAELIQVFPSSSPVSGGALVPETIGRDAGSQVTNDNLPSPTKLDNAVALGLLGSQFSGLSEVSTSEGKGYRLYNECLGFDKDEEILFTLESDPDAAPSKTWFDLAREYLATRSSSANSDSSSVNVLRNKKDRMQISCEGKDDSSLTLRGGFTVPEKGFHGTDISSAFSHPRRHSSYDIEFEHIEYLLSDAEIESQVGVEAHEETPSTISELSLGLGTEMVQATTGARRPTSSVSYTSYIEAEFAAASLYQRPLGISTEKTGTFHQSSTANHNPKMPSTEVDTSDRYLHTKGGLDARIISIGSFASGFRFTDYATELPESKMDDETIICVKDIEGDVMGDEEDVQVVHETMNFKQEVDEEVSVAPEYVPIFGDIEPADLVRESNNSPQAITTEDLNIRMIGKAARKSLRMKRETGKIGGLIDIFQARGLMPQNLKSPIHRPQGPLTQHESSPSRSTTMGTTPFGLPPFPYRNSKDFPFQLESTQRKPRCAILLSRSYSGASDADTEISSVSGYSLERSEKRQENEKKRRDDRDSDMYG